MGIRDRDYMRGDDDDRGRSAHGGEEKLEGVVGEALGKHKRLIKVVVLVFVLLVIAGIVMAMLGM